MNVSSRAARAAVLGIAALALASCSDVHPGSAAVVDGRTITMETVDESADAYCQLGLVVAAQQGIEAISKADSRRQTVADMVTLMVAREVAAERDLEINAKDFAISEDQKGQILQAFAGKDLDGITNAIADSQETYAIIIALGAEATGKTATEANAQELEAAGQKELQKAIKAADVEFDPRFGLDDTVNQVAVTGPLSVAESTKKIDPADLPASQRCS